MAEVETPQSQSKRKAKKATESTDLEGIQADVASFAAQLGLASGGAFGPGFDDSDFRKTGRIGEKKTKTKKGGDADGVVKEEKSVEKSKSPGGKGMKDGRLVHPEVKGKERKSGDDVGLSFGSGTKAGVAVEVGKGKGKKRSLPSDVSGQGYEKSAKKERFSEGDSKSGAPAPSMKLVSLDRSLAKSFQSAALWYEGVAAAAVNPKAKTEKDVAAMKGEESSASKLKEAEQLMEKAVADYEKSRSKDSDTRWLMTARRSGTSSDKVAAMTVMLQDNPMLNLRTLDALIGRVGIPSRLSWISVVSRNAPTV